MAEQNEMLKIITPMMEHVCDHLCRWRMEMASQEDLEAICAECQMGKYVCDILNTYSAAGQLQTAAEVVRNEFLQKGDWYRALVNFIYRYLRDFDISVPWGLVARELADRIVGIEPEQEGE